MVSIGITFALFCVIIVLSLIKPYLSAGRQFTRNLGYYTIDENINSDDVITHERIEDPELEPLINHAPKPATVASSAIYTATVTEVST